MVTASNEGNLKVWDISASQPELIAEKALAIGAVQCLSSCPENPFIHGLGGDFKAKNFGVWDITKMETGRNMSIRNYRFCKFTSKLCFFSQLCKGSDLGSKLRWQ